MRQAMSGIFEHVRQYQVNQDKNCQMSDIFTHKFYLINQFFGTAVFHPNTSKFFD